MKAPLILLILSGLTGCMITPKPAIEETAISSPEQPEQTLVAETVEPELATLKLDDTASSLQAWVNYRAALLTQLNEERELLNAQQEKDDVWTLKRTLLQLHPDTPYLTRLKLQMQLVDQLASLPPSLAALLSWDLAFNQKLLEAESAVSALTRLNAQQHDNIERLQKTNKELQKKIDALTQIEAQLNQPSAEDNNGKL